MKNSMTNAYRLFFLLCSLALLLCGCGSSHRERLQQLETLEAFNIADSVMTNDSLAQVLCDYFDEHGTPNERLRAHYILGRTYADLGEAPAALEAYLDAAAAADTTATDCDWAKLSRVYGQMSSVFYDQNLIDNYLSSQGRSIDYAWRANDTLQALAETAYKVIGFERKQQYEEAATLYAKIYGQLKEMYGTALASRYSLAAIRSCLETQRMDEVKSYLNDIRYYSGYLDSTMKATVGREIYYYYFGEYYRCTGNRDSAEYFFRKELEEASDYNNQNAAARGLSQLYNESGQNDSATKYALYSYAMNDSVYAQMSIQSVAQALSSFNYNRNKELAAKEGVRAEKEHARSRRLLFAIFLILTIVILVYLRQRRKSMVQSAKYRAAVIERNKLRKEIESLAAKD